MDRADDRFRDMRLEFAQLPSGEHGIVDAISVELACPGDRLVQALFSAETIEPASVVHNALSREAGLGISASCSSTHPTISGASACAERSMRRGVAFCQ